MPTIRLLALDVDGTLAARGHEVTPATRSALHQVAEAGVEVVIATGRRYRSTRYVIDNLGLRVRAVVLGGALLKAGDGRTLSAIPFEGEDFRAAHAVTRELGLAVVCQRDPAEGAGDFAVGSDVSWNVATRRYVEQNREHATLHDDFGEAGCPGALVVGVFAEEEDELRVLAERLEDAHPGRFFANVLPAGKNGGWYCEIARARVSKWSGLRRLAPDLEASQICAVGDQVNDLPMLAEAGMAVAMGNAPPEVQDRAHWTTGACDEDGIVAVVERILSR